MELISREAVPVQAEGLTIDLLVWRRFRRPMEGLVEALLDLPENQHLSGLPAVLPLGTVVTIPIPRERAAEAPAVTSLWD